MSPFARRTLRVSAAAAGVAALGFGIAGPAFAAPGVPDLPALPGPDAAAPAAPGRAAVADRLDGPMSEALASIPEAFQMPTADSMAIPAAAPSADNPTAAAPDGVVTMHGGLGQVQSLPTVPDALQALDTNDVAALPSADAVQAVAGLSQLTSGNHVGTP